MQVSQEKTTVMTPSTKPGIVESTKQLIHVLFVRWYRVIVNSLLLTWLAIGWWTVAQHSLRLSAIYLLLIIVNLFFVALADCRTCPRRLGKCTHFYIGRLTRLLPPKDEANQSRIAHARVLGVWVIVHAIPQVWLWQQSKLLLAVFWAAPALALVFLRMVVCWQMCGNKQCPMNRTTHPMPWEQEKPALIQIQIR